VTLTRDGNVVKREEHEDPLAFIDAYLASFRAAPMRSGPRFAGGVAGYFGYEAVRYVEPRLRRAAKPDPLGLPDIRLLLTEELAVVDNLSGKLYLIVYADPGEPQAHARALARLEELRKQLRKPAELPASCARALARAPEIQHRRQGVLRVGGEEQAIHPRRRHDAGADLAAASRPVSVLAGEPLSRAALDQSLAVHVLFRLRRRAAGRRIAGDPGAPRSRQGDAAAHRRTRKRGATPEKDLEMERELVGDPKERAEHLMLIDLGRNDVGRIAKVGSVKVTETMVVERYSHVMHMVSNVEGMIDPALTPMELLRATFPAGTVTGAPKVRAMEIIDELETEKRGVYAGAAGYIGFNGNIDLAISIRTGVVKDRKLFVQAAAGIVADSVPEMEWRETQNKVRAVLAAAEQVHAGLDAPLS
jgi:anthranilate synthase component 1